MLLFVALAHGHAVPAVHAAGLSRAADRPAAAIAVAAVLIGTVAAGGFDRACPLALAGSKLAPVRRERMLHLLPTGTRFGPGYKMTDYLRETHHEFEAASAQALADPELQRILGQLNDTLGQRNRDAWAALPNSDLIRERARTIKDQTLAELRPAPGNAGAERPRPAAATCTGRPTAAKPAAIVVELIRRGKRRGSSSRSR